MIAPIQALTLPLDTAKVRLQVQKKGAATPKYKYVRTRSRTSLATDVLAPANELSLCLVAQGLDRDLCHDRT